MTPIEKPNISSDESDTENVEDAKREGIELGKKNCSHRPRK